MGIAFAAVLAILVSAMLVPSAFAAQADARTGALAAADLSAQSSATYTQTKIGYQVVPIKLKAGAVKLSFKSDASSGSVGIYADADEDGNTTGSVASVYTSDPYGSGSRYGNIAKSGTYYLLFYTSSYSGSTGSTATVTQYPYKATKTAKLNGSTLGTGCGNYDKVAYYKISVKKRGYIVLKVADATGYSYSSQAKLCNAKKKSLTGSYFDSTSADRAVYYGVKKGTYYIAVKSYASLYRVKPVFKAAKRAVKNKKSKAVLVKRGKTTSAVMAAGEKTAWYKFRVTKKRAYTITLKGKLHDSLRMNFSGAGYYSYSAYLNSGASSKTFKTNKLKKGTYYIQVTRSGTGTGLYSITWK